MRRLCTWAFLALLIPAGSLVGAQGGGTIKKIDLDKNIVVIHTVADLERTLKIDKDVKVLDAQGKALADGMKSKELKEGARVTVTFEQDGKDFILKGLQLGPKDTTDPNRKSVGFKPLCDMTADDKHKGEDGGLYGAGKNVPPAEHQAAAKKETARIVPLDAEGKPVKDGKIGLISIGYSNVTQMYSAFKRLADADPQKSPLVSIVDCAQGGQTMAAWARADAKCWDVADDQLKKARLTPKQVQVVWMKLANAGPKGEFADHARRLKTDTVTVLQNLKKHFPNLRVVYLGSRIYGGYATGALNPEPYAYEGAFAARWVIQDQIKKEAALNYDAERGDVKAPLVLWGPYLWADGTTPRKTDGLVWDIKDMAGDGVHPSPGGQKKVAAMLLDFLKTDANARTWFVKPAGDK